MNYSSLSALWRRLVWLTVWLLPVFGASTALAQTFLPVDEAFRLEVRASGPRAVQVSFVQAPGVYLYREQMDNGKLNGHEFAVSNQLPNGSGSNRPTNVVLGNFSEFMIGRQGSMESEMFREGTVTDEDGNTISAVDQDCTILRIIDLHDFGIRHEESFVIGKNMQTQK